MTSLGLVPWQPPRSLETTKKSIWQRLLRQGGKKDQTQIEIQIFIEAP